MNSKIKKILAVIVLILMSILLINTKVEAKNIGYSAKDVIAAAYEAENYHKADVIDGAPGNNTFCVYVKEDLWPLSTYNVVNYIYIDGKTSTIYEGNRDSGRGVLATHNATENVAMAWILNQADEGGHPYQNIYSNKQLAVYGYFDTWLRANGLVFTHRNTDSSGNTYTNPSWIAQANQYAANYTGENKASITNNTNQDNISIENYQIGEDEYIKVGPLNFTYKDSIESIKVYNQDNQEISAKYGVYEGTNLKIADNPADVVKSGVDFYILIREDGNTSYINKVQAHVTASREQLKAEIWTLSRNGGKDNQNLITTDAQVIREPDRTDQNLIEEPIPLIGDLDVVKVVQLAGEDPNNPEILKRPLQGVGFIIQRKNDGKYVKVENGEISYVNKDENPTEFLTDENGHIVIEDLIVGTYVAYETQNPHYGYEILDEGQEVEVEVKKDDPDYIKNKKKYIKLSGYVWEDIQKDKTSHLDGYYTEDSNEKGTDKDLRVPGIIVNLINRDTNQIEKTTVTDENGEYQFVDVEVEKVAGDKYYIEFQYDGITYTNVLPRKEDGSVWENEEDKNKFPTDYLAKDNSSKAKEPEKSRNDFNDEFATIEGGDARDKGISKGVDGEKTHDLSYELGDHEAKFINEGQFKINAITDETGYKIVNQFTYLTEEIKWINLGLERRDEPDLAVQKDVSNVKLTVNNKQRVYLYENRFTNEEFEDRFNIGVKFRENEYEQTYTRPIYKSDYEYITEDGSNELEVYITYAIALKNKASDVTSQINSLIDYYDSRYGEPIAVGTEKNDENGTVTNNLKYSTPVDYDNNYKKIIIETNIKLPVNNQRTEIYVQFKLSREQVVDILNGKEPLENVTEINSYSSFEDDGTPYAGIDKNSNPANAIPGDESTHEDDTDTSPALVLEATDARTIQGTVFEDNAKEPTGTGNERIGDGLYDNTKEHGISGVIVTLEEQGKAEGKGIKYIVEGTAPAEGTYDIETTATDSSGNEIDPNGEIPEGSTIRIKYKESGSQIELKEGDYYIPGFIPGDYKIVYTWGGQTWGPDDSKITYTVQNYKSTIYVDQNRYTNNYGQNGDIGNVLWYKDNVDSRYSDAVDNYNTDEEVPYGSRVQIDKEITDNANNYTPSKPAYTRTQMNSSSPEMDIGIEYDSNVTQVGPDGKVILFEVKNADFGIIKRPEQSIKLDKRIDTIKITLANGQEIVNARVVEDADGNRHLEGETGDLMYMGPGIAGVQPPNGFARLEMDSELIQGSKLEVTYKITATNISEIDYDTEEYYNFGIKGNDTNIRKLVASEIIDYLDKDWGFDQSLNPDWTTKTISDLESMVMEDVYTVGEDDTNTINDKIILWTDKLAQTELDPINTNTADVYLSCSKVLANSDELTFDNETEIIKLDRPNGGSEPTPPTPGNYVPGKGDQESDDSMSETVMITPNTGENMNYIVPISIGIAALVILGVGVFLIKRKIIDNK